MRTDKCIYSNFFFTLDAKFQIIYRLAFFVHEFFSRACDKIRGHHTSFPTSLVSRLFVVSILYPVFLPIVQQIFYSQTIALFISVKKGHRFALQPFFVISRKRGE